MTVSILAIRGAWLGGFVTSRVGSIDDGVEENGDLGWGKFVLRDEGKDEDCSSLGQHFRRPGGVQEQALGRKKEEQKNENVGHSARE
jgi:hypothetical protein